MIKCKVVAELKDDLITLEREDITKYIHECENRFDIISIDHNEFIKNNESDVYGSDFASVMGFYFLLSQRKHNFKSLKFF